MDQSEYDKKRERTRQLAAEFNERGDPMGWFDALYKESGGDIEKIPWADMEPNRFFKAWAEANGLRGEGRTALVVGCGLGDDAKYLHDLGFKVTAFDISPTAIEWAGKVYGDAGIQFEVADLFDPPREWVYQSAPPPEAGGTDEEEKDPAAHAGGNEGRGELKNPPAYAGGSDFVLEIYTIQPLPMEMRPRVIDSIAAFVAPGGRLVVVAYGRDDDEETDLVPWPLSRRDLSRFGENGLREAGFQEVWDEEDEKRRFIVEYVRD
jgi:SAM-dependent methyltransferase